MLTKKQLRVRCLVVYSLWGIPVFTHDGIVECSFSDVWSERFCIWDASTVNESHDTRDASAPRATGGAARRAPAELGGHSTSRGLGPCCPVLGAGRASAGAWSGASSAGRWSLRYASNASTDPEHPVWRGTDATSIWHVWSTNSRRKSSLNIAVCICLC